MSDSAEFIAFRRLKMQCRRGMLELDLLLEPFLETGYFSLSEEDKGLFNKLLACEDQELFVWFMQRETPEDTELAHIVNMILTRVQPEHYRA
ncbi:MAG: succinate dehydrogenase assembly factor 2 [Marinomonas sp.]